MEDDVESPASSGFFSRRANLYPKKSAEELQAAAELVKKIEQENSKISEIERVVTPINKPRKKVKKPPPLLQDHGKDIILDDSFSEVILSSSAKKRLKKLHDEQEKELERIEAENQRILSSVNMNSAYSIETVKDVAEDFEKLTVLTVMYMSKVTRLKCYENDKFLDIFPKVAELFNLKVTEFLLCIKTKNITVDDTPKSLKITDQDIIECIPYKAEENTKTETEDNGNAFKICFQSNDTKSKIDLFVHKVEKMKDIMKRYSDERNVPLEQLVFEFDGERLLGEETPAELDMESESCIDVTVLIPTPKAPSGEVSPVLLDMDTESSNDAIYLTSAQSDEQTPIDLDIEPEICNEVIVVASDPQAPSNDIIYVTSAPQSSSIKAIGEAYAPRAPSNVANVTSAPKTRSKRGRRKKR